MNSIMRYFPSTNIDFYYITILSATFISVALIVGCAVYLVINREKIADRLSKLLPQGKSQESSAQIKLKLVDSEPEGLTYKISKPLHKIALSSPADSVSSVRLRLIQAGLRSKQSFVNFLCLKMLGAIILPLAFLASSLVFKISMERLGILILLAIIGFFLPDIILFIMASNRKTLLSKALPDALDLMVVCVEAGLGLDMTFKRVGEEIRPICKELSDEFFLTNLEIRSGHSRLESFKNMSHRTGVPEISQLMTMLAQTSRFGTSVAKALRVHSDAMRIKRRQRAEETAAKAAIKLLFPLVFFIFPALFVVILGPGMIQVVRILLPTLSGE